MTIRLHQAFGAPELSDQEVETMLSLPSRWHVYYDHGSHIGGHAGQVVGARPQRDIYRQDALPQTGTPGGDLELMREQLLDFFDVRQAILSPLEVLGWPSYGEESGAFIRALNDWMIDEWLERDPRLYGAISIPVEDGARAAKEIARAAENPRFMTILMTMVTREGFGHPKYWPIYEVASDLGLPVAAHVGGFSGTHMATGWPSYFVEQHAGYTQPYQAQIVSLAYSGVFDRFPNLQIVVEEVASAGCPPSCGAWTASGNRCGSMRRTWTGHRRRSCASTSGSPPSPSTSPSEPSTSPSCSINWT